MDKEYISHNPFYLVLYFISHSQINSGPLTMFHLFEGTVIIPWHFNYISWGTEKVLNELHSAWNKDRHILNKEIEKVFKNLMKLNEVIWRYNLCLAIEFKEYIFICGFYTSKTQEPIYFHVYCIDFNLSYSDCIWISKQNMDEKFSWKVVFAFDFSQGILN